MTEYRDLELKRMLFPYIFAAEITLIWENKDP